MILKLTADEQTYDIEVPESIIQEAEEFYAKIDQDMDQGWQMSRIWVEHLDLYQRCQVVADRIFGAFHTENQQMAVLMAGYILSRVPHVHEVIVDTTGDITQTEIIA
jgi:hypothetical protein